MLILTGLAALAAAVGFAVAGSTGLMVATGGIAFLWFLVPQVPSPWILRAVNGRRLIRGQAPALFEIRDALVRRAGLRRAPALYLLPDRAPQAFTLGEQDDAAIVVSAGLLRTLDRRELTGVLAHEMSHVAHDDIRLLRFASTLAHVTQGLSRAAALVALVAFPMILFGAVVLDPWALLAVVVAPWAAQALLLSLSRTREHAADVGAARLTGDPEGLARALVRLEARKHGFWDRLFGVRSPTLPAWLQTHPVTEDRIRRVMADATSRKPQSAGWGAHDERSGPRRARVVARRGPRVTILRAV